jgi:hypothetical protein
VRTHPTTNLLTQPPTHSPNHQPTHPTTNPLTQPPTHTSMNILCVITNIQRVGGSFNQTTTLAAVLSWGGDEGSCDDLGIVVGRTKSTGRHIVETFAQYNARHYWRVFDTLTPVKTAPTLFPISDSYRTGDGDIASMRVALRASRRVGLHGMNSACPAWLQKQELGYALTSASGEVALLEYSPNAPNIGTHKIDANLSAWAASVASTPLSLGYKPSDVVLSPIHDEPGMAIPADLPPIGNASFKAVSDRWVKYLQDQGLTPQLLGSKSWNEVMPSTAGGVAGASIEARRLYYHSLRFVSWASSRYLANATRALESNLVTGASIYVNWNNMAAHWYGRACHHCHVTYRNHHTHRPPPQPPLTPVGPPQPPPPPQPTTTTLFTTATYHPQHTSTHNSQRSGTTRRRPSTHHTHHTHHTHQRRRPPLPTPSRRVRLITIGSSLRAREGLRCFGPRTGLVTAWRGSGAITLPS